MTPDEFNTFIASVEASFSPTLEELKQAVRDAGAAHARQLKADMAKPRQLYSQAQMAANCTTYAGGPETTRQVYDRCVAALKARVSGTAAVAASNAAVWLANAGHQRTMAMQSALAAANANCSSWTGRA